MPATLTPQTFIAKSRKVALKESAAAKEHFVDLCRLLDHPTPADADADGTNFTFEYDAAKLGGGQGFADVFKRGFFGWEYKRTLTNLYNARPTWLDSAHRKLDAAVFAAYGWPAGLSDEEILARLLALNLARAGGK